MSDKHGMMKLNNENYEIWKILMEAILVRKQLRDVALGVTARPTGGQNAIRAWDRKNQEARAELQLAVEPDQLAHMTAELAPEIWNELERVHRSTGFTTRMGLKRTLWKMKMKDGQRMASWIADVRGIVFQLTQIGVSVPDEDFILALTNGLPPHYENLVLALDSTPSDLFSVDYVIGRLRTEESRQRTAVASEFGGTDSSDQALAAMLKRTGTAHITCFSCGQKGHYQANCPTAPVPPRTATPTRPVGSANTVTDEGFDAAW
jgi:hypothetical protein